MISKSVLALGAVLIPLASIPAAEANDLHGGGGGRATQASGHHGGGGGLGQTLINAAIRGAAEGLTESAYASRWYPPPVYSWGEPDFFWNAPYSPAYSDAPPPPVYYPTTMMAAPGVATPAFVVMPASARPYLQMGVPLTPQLIYGLTGANAVAPVYQPYVVPTPPAAQAADTAWHPTWEVNP
jgi:hypothetical protein